MSAIRSGYKQTEVGVIPGDWDIAQIGEFEPFVTSGSRGWTAYYSEYGSPFIRITNLSRTCIYPDLSDLRYVDVGGNDSEAARTQLRNGDVLVSITADIGIIGYVTDDFPQPAYINQHISLVRFDSDRIDSRFIAYFLASENSQKVFRALTDSGAKAGMNLTTVKQTRFALPPTKAEQEAIAKALSDADALIEALEQLLAKKCHLKQGAMQELLTGKKRLPWFSGEWAVKPLGDVADIDSDNLSSTTPAEFAFKYISLEDVDSGSLRSYSEQSFYSAPSRARRRLRAGDILVSTVRPNLQSHLLFDSDENDWICSTGFSVVRCRASDAIPGYVFFHMFSHLVARQIEMLLTGSNYPAINGRDVKALEIPMPSLAEQTAIAAVLSDMGTEIAGLESELAKTHTLKQGMLQKLLTGEIRLI